MTPNKIIQQQKEVEAFLAQCGLSQYFQVFMEEGFERMESLMEITELDLVQMQVKRGHRRLLQRAVANAKGIPPNVPLSMAQTNFNNSSLSSDIIMADGVISSPPPASSPMSNNNIMYNSPTATLSYPSQPPENYYYPSAGTMSAQSGMSSTEEEAVTSDNIHRIWKRKYHRHPKPDTNAPIKPPSAYVMFSNDVRAELKQQNKSFTDLAKIIGDRWKSISPEEKEFYETNALKAREEYLKQIEEYQKTENYKKYQQYLSEFKAENEAAARPVGRPRKRQVKAIQQQQQYYAYQHNNEDNTSDTKRSQRQYPFYLLNADDNNRTNDDQSSHPTNTTSSSK
ncbi:HMG-box [Rhizopus microsporus var. microsporus]|uniref:HMG-box n=2 Tax=Rhizopus microsporus TaxID=58291 RepID=A0A2G4SGY9_RHIZD|nr:HMG-box [Rhizopus microsporus ATCC 52813]ORE07369.1 HMG-box [Rhizopus microsporus var. microsporus]PHZ08037.1 HMG-box [Rhizopus microsporus ATCC 52813]